MSRIAAAALMVASAVALGITPQVIATNAPKPVDQSPGSQTDPHISNLLVAYTDGTPGSGSVIRFKDVTTAPGAGAAIPSGGAGTSDALSDISGNRIVFTRVNPDGTSNIYAYDVSTGTVVGIDLTNAAVREHASVGGNTVVWENSDGYSTTQIYRADLTSPSPVAIPVTSDGNNHFSPAVSPSGQVIVFISCQSGASNCNVQQSVNGGSPTNVTPAGVADGDESQPDTNGAVVVYSAARPGFDQDIHWTPVAGGAEQSLVLAGNDVNPNISGNLVAFEHTEPGTTNADLFVLDISTGAVYQLTNTPAVNEELNDISIGSDGVVRVVYSVNGGISGNDVWVVSFSVPAPATDGGTGGTDGGGDGEPCGHEHDHHGHNGHHGHHGVWGDNGRAPGHSPRIGGCPDGDDQDGDDSAGDVGHGSDELSSVGPANDGGGCSSSGNQLLMWLAAFVVVALMARPRAAAVRVRSRK